MGVSSSPDPISIDTGHYRHHSQIDYFLCVSLGHYVSVLSKVVIQAGTSTRQTYMHSSCLQIKRITDRKIYYMGHRDYQWITKYQEGVGEGVGGVEGGGETMQFML